MNGSEYEFPPFRIDGAQRVLLRDGAPVVLPRKALDTLLILVAQHGSMVGKEDLMKAVWPDSFVEENNLNQCISAIRKALGDNSAAPRFIETVSGRGYRFLAKVRSTETATHGPRMLAILPLRPLGGDHEDDYLGAGIADSLITRLSNVRELQVRPTSAVLKYLESDADPVDAGRALGVDAVLEGRIRKAHDRIRVTVQLVSVADGATIWAERFDGAFTGIFAVEDSISERVAEQLTQRLTAHERTAITRHSTANSEAYLLYLSGRYASNRLTREDLGKAIELMRRAVALDPMYALGYAGLAYAFLNSADLIFPSDEAFTNAEAAARKALEIDPTLVDAITTIGCVRWHRDRDAAGARYEFERAVALDPRNVLARRLFGWCLVFMDEAEESFTHLDAADALDPLSDESDFYGMPALYFARRFDETIVRADTMREHWIKHVILGRTYEAQGRLDDAIAAYERAHRADRSIAEPLGDLGRALGLAGHTARAKKVLAQLQNAPPFTVANVHLGLGDYDRVFALFEEALAAHSWYMTWLTVSPTLDPLRGDPRLTRMLP